MFSQQVTFPGTRSSRCPRRSDPICLSGDRHAGSSLRTPSRTRRGRHQARHTPGGSLQARRGRRQPRPRRLLATASKKRLSFGLPQELPSDPPSRALGVHALTMTRLDPASDAPPRLSPSCPPCCSRGLSQEDQYRLVADRNFPVPSPRVTQHQSPGRPRRVSRGGGVDRFPILGSLSSHDAGQQGRATGPKDPQGDGTRPHRHGSTPGFRPRIGSGP